MLANTVQMSQRRRPQLTTLTPALPWRSPCTREGPAALRGSPGEAALCNTDLYPPVLPPPQPRTQTRSQPDPARRSPAEGHPTGLQPGRRHPRHHHIPSPCWAAAHPGDGALGGCPAAPPRSSPRYSGPGSESRSGLSILLPPLPLPPSFRPFPRRPTLPALLGRSPRLGTRPLGDRVPRPKPPGQAS